MRLTFTNRIANFQGDLGHILTTRPTPQLCAGPGYFVKSTHGYIFENIYSANMIGANEIKIKMHPPNDPIRS